MRMFSLLLLAGAALTAALPAAAQSQGYPNRTVRIIVPFPAGATLDAAARQLAPRLKEKLGQTFVVENRAGASGNIGAEYVLNSPADGYTLLFTAPATLVVNKLLYPKIGFDHTSFTPITLAAQSPFVLFVHPKLPIHNLSEFVAYAKANPGKLSFGSMGVGSASHLILEAFDAAAGTQILHVPFQGAAPALTALLGGQVDTMVNGLTSTLPQVQKGALRPIANTAAKRDPRLPDIPTLGEFYPKLAPTGNWFAFLAPAGTPKDVADKIATAVSEVLKQPDVVASFDKMMVNPVGSTPAELQRYMANEAKVWGDVARANNITGE